MPSATSRATSNSRAVSGRQGSSSAPRPRAIASSSSARRRSGRAREGIGRGRSRRAASGRPRPRGWRAAGRLRGRAVPRAPPRSDLARPSRPPQPRARCGPQRSSRCWCAAGPRRGRARAGPARPSREQRGQLVRSQRSAASGRRAASAARTPVTTNGTRRARSFVGRARSSASRHHVERERPARRRRAPSRPAPTSRAGEVDLARRTADRRATPRAGSVPGRLTAPEGDEAEDVARAERPAPAAVLDELDPGRRDGLVPSTGCPGEVRRRRGHHVAAVRLLDLVRVAHALAHPELRGRVVHHAHGNRPPPIGRR